MAKPKTLTTKELAALRREFALLQEEMRNLKFEPGKLVEGLETFQQAMAESSASLIEQSQAIEINKEAYKSLHEELKSGNIESQRRKEIQAEMRDIDRENSQLIQDNDKNIQDFKKTLEAEGPALEANAAAKIRYAEAMQLLKAGDIAGAKRKMKEATADLKKNTDATKEGAAEADNLAKSFFKLSPAMSRLGGFVKKLNKPGLKGMAEGFKNLSMKSEIFLNVGLKLVDLSLSMLMAQIKFALAQHASIADFRKATGAGNEFNSMMVETEITLRQAGVTMDEVGAAYTSLKNDVVSFTTLSRSQQVELGKTTSLLAELGFSLGTQADILQVSMESMNMSVEESQQLLVDLAGTARSLGMDMDKLGQQFVANKEFIVGFGKDGTKIFEEMAVQAKSLGMELGTLTGVVDKFTTFDQAGQSVGRLNAILGGPFLNSIDMLNAAMEDPAEAVNMLRDSFDQAGVSLEDMGRAEKMAFASALGMSVEDMTNMMGKSTEQIELQRLKQEELAEQSRQTMAITDQLKTAMLGFYVNMQPFIEETLVPMIGHLATLASAMGKFFGSTAGMVTFFMIFGGLLVGGIALVTAFALANAAAATASVFGAPFAAAAMGLLVGAGVAAAFGVAALGLAGLGTVFAAMGGTASGGGGGGAKPKEKTKGRFAAGGLVTGTAMAMVGEQGPEMVEMPIGSRVTNAPTTQMLTAALLKLTKKLDRMNLDRGNIAVYVGDKEVTDIVVKAMNSSKAKQAISPYGQ